MSFLEEDFEKVLGGALSAEVQVIRRNSHTPNVLTALVRLNTSKVRHVRLVRTDAEYIAEGTDSQLADGSSAQLLPYSAIEPVTFAGHRWLVLVRPYTQETLKGLLDKGDLDASHVSDVVAIVCRATIALHAADRLHGDIRPSNVLIEQSPGSWLLGDYLFPAITRSTWEYIPRGRTAYVAPEVLAGSELSAASDVFAIGALLKQLESYTASERMLTLRRRSRQLNAALREVASTCLLPAARRRPSVQDIYSALFEFEVLHKRLLDPDRVRLVRSLAERNFVSDYDVRHTLGHSRPLEQAVSRAYELLTNTAAEDVGLCLWLQNPDTHVEQTMRLAYSLLQGYSSTDKVIQRQLKLEGRDIDAGRRIQPPDLDEEWRAEIFADHRQLLEDVTPAAYESEEARLATIVDYNFSPSDVLNRLERALQAAADLRKNVLTNIPYITSSDLLDQQAFAPESALDEDALGQLVDSGLLLAIRDHGRVLFPSFQFLFSDRGVVPRPEIAEVNNVLGPQGRGWARLLWWLSESPRLGDRAPRALLDTSDARSIVQLAAAERRLY